jgi:hypothetical protein
MTAFPVCLLQDYQASAIELVAQNLHEFAPGSLDADFKNTIPSIAKSKT